MIRLSIQITPLPLYPPPSHPHRPSLNRFECFRGRHEVHRHRQQSTCHYQQPQLYATQGHSQSQRRKLVITVKSYSRSAMQLHSSTSNKVSQVSISSFDKVMLKVLAAAAVVSSALSAVVPACSGCRTSLSSFTRLFSFHELVFPAGKRLVLTRRVPCCRASGASPTLPAKVLPLHPSPALNQEIDRQPQTAKASEKARGDPSNSQHTMTMRKSPRRHNNPRGAVNA